MADYNADRMGYLWCSRCQHKHAGPCSNNANTGGEVDRNVPASDLEITHSLSFNTTGRGLTMGDIRELAKHRIPNDAEVDITKTKYVGDQREPGYTTVKISWTP